MRRPSLRLLRAALPVLMLGALGCVGDIGDRAPGVSGPNPGGEAAGDPGRVTLHRLNRVEYDNTVRDLLGTKQTPADDFPTDDYGYGFDNIADVLSMSPLQLELYERAAEALAEEALAAPSTAATTKTEAETLTSPVGVATADAWNLFSNGEIGTTVTLPEKGDYKISARVWGQQAGTDPVKMSLLVGGVSIGDFDVTATSANPAIVEATTTIDAGTKVISVEFLNDFYDMATSKDRNLLVDWIQIEGPLGVSGANPIRDTIVTCDPASGAACVRTIVGDFATRAWRRPLTDAELDALVAFVDLAKAEGDSVDEGLKVALRATLVSPNFVFRVELDPEPTSTKQHPLGAYELASRLSYFLWSSMPDEELFEAAEAGQLSDPVEIEKQVRRMLDDDKAGALVENFGGEWLYTRGLVDHQPDYATFPDFDEPLRDAMRTETQLFFGEFLHGDHEIGEMLTANFTFLNDRLAQHYGLPPVGSEFKKVDLDSAQRGGLVTQGSLLTVTSYPKRTSPVRRGKWILQQLLCSEPPPPPPGVGKLPMDDKPAGSLREIMEAHRKDPKCASCHAVMDPLGFSLENYDGIGVWRTKDSGYAIDATGTLPTGEAFDGGAEMAGLIGKDPRFGKCVARQLYTYALGRGPESTDDAFLDAIGAKFDETGHTFTDLIVLIAKSEPFRMRHGELPEGGKP